MAISIEPTQDIDLIRRIITEPEIWDRISQDGYFARDYEPSLDDLWLALVVDGETVGLYAFDNLRGISCDIHPYVLANHRASVARKGLFLSLEYLFHNFCKIQKVNAVIPTIYRSVYNFALNSGFTSEGVNRKSFMKNGESCDQWIVGITRSEYERN